MENDIFTASLSTTDHNHVIFNAVLPNIFSSPFMSSGTMDDSCYEQIMAGNPLFSTRQEDGSLNNVCIPNNGGVFLGDMPISRTMLQFGNSFSDGYNENADMGTSHSATSLVNLLSPNTRSPREKLSSIDNSATLALPLNMRAFVSTDTNDSLDSSHPTPRNCGYGTQDGTDYSSLGAVSTVHPSYHVRGSSMTGWDANNSSLKMDHLESYCLPKYELSLSLGSCQPSSNNMPDIQGHCSEKACSDEAVVKPKYSDGLALYSGPSNAVHFPPVLLGSRFLAVAQQILAEITNYALGNSDQVDDFLSRTEGEARMPFSSEVVFNEFTPYRGSEQLEDMDHSLQIEESKKEKSKVVTMLQMIDHGYSQFVDQIQNVVAAFHDIASLGTPKMHGWFARHTISSIYKNLREQITKHLRSQECIEKYKREEQKDFESSFIRKQWALQQLGRKDQQSWRPQRGLPERSVSVLRAWMFQNFLHPYPKDRDKHLLAIQSGLTRNQVSNWFINARVRLWKPMIDEMYSDMKKHQSTGEGIQGDFGCRSQII